MKSVIISIKPKDCELIANEKMTIKVLKNRPKIETPFKCYIYVTKPKKWFRFSDWGYASDECLWLSNGKVKMCDGFEFWADGREYEPLCCKVIGEFVCDKVTEYIAYKTQKGSKLCKNPFFYACLPIQEMCLTIEQVEDYGKGETLYGWHISDLKIYDKPKELSEFKRWNRTEENAPCAHTKWLYPDCKDCKECNLTRPPKSWCYVEEA